MAGHIPPRFAKARLSVLPGSGNPFSRKKTGFSRDQKRLPSSDGASVELCQDHGPDAVGSQLGEVTRAGRNPASSNSHAHQTRVATDAARGPYGPLSLGSVQV